MDVLRIRNLKLILIPKQFRKRKIIRLITFHIQWTVEYLINWDVMYLLCLNAIRAEWSNKSTFMLLNPTQPLDAQLCSITGISGSHQEILITNPFAIVSWSCSTCHSISVGPSATRYCLYGIFNSNNQRQEGLMNLFVLSCLPYRRIRSVQ